MRARYKGPPKEAMNGGNHLSDSQHLSENWENNENQGFPADKTLKTAFLLLDDSPP